jgi:hypothetical protein
MDQSKRGVRCGRFLLVWVICLSSCLMLVERTEVFGYEGGEQLPVSFEGGFALPMGTAFSTPCDDSGVFAATQCWRPTKSSRYSPTDVLQSYLKYAYNTVGRLTKTSRYKPSDATNPESYVTYKYNTKGQITDVSVFDGSTLKYKGTSQYNTTGRLTKGSAYDDNGTLIYYGVCTYNTSGKISKVSAYTPDKSLQYVARIQYSSGRITKVSIYNASDVIQAYITYNYDGKGRLSRETLHIYVWGIDIKYYYTTYTYALVSKCPGGNSDPLFFWAMLASFLEL